MKQASLREELCLGALAGTGRTEEYEARYWRNPS